MPTPLAKLTLVLAIPALASPSLAAENDARASASPRIEISFKLDPRLSGPTYGGERWVSPKTYRGASAQATVDARAAAVDARGRPVKMNIQWIASDPEKVAVSPGTGEQVRITARRAGESVVTVKAGGSSRDLTVKLVETSGITQLSISQ